VVVKSYPHLREAFLIRWLQVRVLPGVLLHFIALYCRPCSNSAIFKGFGKVCELFIFVLYARSIASGYYFEEAQLLRRVLTGELSA
jgi:hypothetical protein